MFLDQCTEDQEEEIIKHFRAKHPRAQFIDTGQRWDGYYVKLYKNNKMSRMFLAELAAICQKCSIPLEVRDLRGSPNYPAPQPEQIGNDFLPGIILYDYQVEAIRTCCRKEHGIISVPTGGGKTEIISGVIKAYRSPTIVLTEQLVILKQIEETLNLRKVAGETSKEVGTFYGGQTPDGQIVCVGSIQSAEKYKELISKCDLIIVDECDRAVAKSYKDVLLKYSKARRRFGLSGTPFSPDKPVENLVLREHFGPIIYEVDMQALLDNGRVVDVEYFQVAVGDKANRNNKSTLDIAVREHMIESDQFHKLVSMIVHSDPKARTLVLVEMTDLGRALEEAIPDSLFIYGETSHKKRDAAIEKFQKGEIKCLIGGKIYSVGWI